MKQSLFESRHQGEWEQLSQQLDQLERSRNVPQSSEFPQAYRRLCQHLALAQARGYSSLLVDALQQLALRGHQQLYRTAVGHRPVCRRSSWPAFPGWCVNNGGSCWRPA